jgi:hypothetical protein
MAVQFLEFSNPLWIKQVCATSQNLPHFDKGWSQLFHGQPHLNGWLQPSQIGGMIQMHGMPCALELVSQPHPTHGITKAMANQSASDFAETPYITRRTQCFNQHIQKIALRKGDSSACDGVRRYRQASSS